MKHTKLERQLVIKEIARRLKDMAYFHSEQLTASMLDSWGLSMILDDASANEYTFTFHVKMVAGDMQQIVGRHRRETAEQRTVGNAKDPNNQASVLDR